MLLHRGHMDRRRLACESRREISGGPGMTTLLLHHPAALDHLTPMGHPERPDRIRAIERALGDERFAALTRALAPEASRESLALAHPEPYIRAIEEASPREGLTRIDADTT